ncbi:uncharacterized protein [Nicotiana sylvestris]|uniref:uncharacterized protein n=1 Tax=Nicotiana sylvestris TaxID=4096 RepID=UPI00388CBC40
MIELVHEGGEIKKPSQTVMMIRASPKEKSTGGEEVVQLEKVDVKPVVVMGKSSHVVAKYPEPVKVTVRGVPSKPACIGPVVIRPVMQMPITSEKAVPWSYSKAMVMYKGKEVVKEVCEAQGLTRSGMCFAPVELRRSNPAVVKKPMKEEEAEEFLKKMKAQDYSIVEQLRKTPAQISLLSMLIHSSDHCQALMKILNEAHVLDKIYVNHLERIVHKIFEVNRVMFSDDELPAEDTEHNKALYLTVKCEDSMVTRVLIDNGSRANNCTLTTLNKLKVDHDRIHRNSVCVRGFDGSGTDTVGDIILGLTIGLVEFTMEFQMVKFEWYRQEIVVHGDEGTSIMSDAVAPFIEIDDDKGPWVYQVFDAVSVAKIFEGEDLPLPRIAAATFMVASKMLNNGFVPGKGLGVDLQDGDLNQGFERLFADVNVIEAGEGSSRADIHSLYIGSNDMACTIDLHPSLKNQSDSELVVQEVDYDDESEYDEDEAFEEINRELSQFEEKPKPNLNDTKVVNLGDADDVRETKISIHTEPNIREELIKALIEFKDVHDCNTGYYKLKYGEA